jgi:hypothetical protein
MLMEAWAAEPLPPAKAALPFLPSLPAVKVLST